MSIVRQNLENEGISDKASKIILSSWRSSTKKQYATYIKKWLNFYSQRHINSLKPSLSSVLDFLTDLFESGLTYSSIIVVLCLMELQLAVMRQSSDL
jgi:hypothetical protein